MVIIFLFFAPFVWVLPGFILSMVPYKRGNQSWWNFGLRDSRSFLVRLSNSFLFVSCISTCMMVSAFNMYFLCFPWTCSFSSKAFLIWLFYFFHFLSLLTLYYGHCTLFNAKLHPSILAVYSNFLYQGLQFYVIFFVNAYISSTYIRWFIFSCDFVTL